MNHAHLALGFTLFATAALAAIGCTSSQDLGCHRSETCPDGIGGGGGSGPDLPKGMRAFMTAAVFDGDLRAAGAKSNGLAGADALCQQAADGATLGGYWVAWISDTTSDAVDRVADDGPWSFAKTTDVAYANRAAVSSGTPSNLTDEHGDVVIATATKTDEFGNTTQYNTYPAYWSGGSASGRSSGHDCSRWTSADVFPASGTTAFGGVPIEDDCIYSQHLLCLQQKLQPTPVPTGLTKRVFVTSKTTSGDLVTMGSKTTPHEAADKLCALAANDGGLGGTWKAWLSARDAQGKLVRATDRLNAEVTAWTLVDGKTAVFDQKSDLMDSPLHSIDQNEFGGLVVKDTPVWTGTLQGGAPASVNTCQNWTSFSVNEFGIAGSANPFAGFDASWTGGPMDIVAEAGRCSDAAALYCFEQ
jgi:hypothetical protein